MAFPTPIAVQDADLALSTDGGWDAVLYLADHAGSSDFPTLHQLITTQSGIDERVGKHTVLLTDPALPGSKLVFAPTGPLNRDFDDVRRVYDAAKSAIQLAVDAGANRPLLIVELQTTSAKYQHAIDVAYLGCCQALWQPLEARESLNEQEIEPVQAIGIVGSHCDVQWLSALEAGRRVARDLCGTEPERMAPPGFADYCVEHFKGTSVAVSVQSDDQRIREQYPLLHAVARASVEVERHQPRVIRLEYTGAGNVEKTLFFAGKGITFDTGGADLKVGGHMAGMSRDKGGAAAVAGFMKVLAEYNPPGIKVVAELGAVRNSIGAEAFVPDEIITGHSGKRVRIGNTDAEGRLVLADILSHLREEAKDAVAPEMFSVATLTGHAAIAFGPYSAFVENGPALALDTAMKVADAGERWADPAEQSRSRREDFDFIKPRTKADDMLSSNNAPSVGTVRGHQFPMAFLTLAAGLDEHGSDCEQPIPYTHIDIAGSGVEKGDWQHGKPSAAPVVAMAARYLKPN